MYSKCNVIFSHFKNVFGRYKQQDDEETLGQIDDDSEDQIPNDDVGEEVRVNNNRE